MADFATLVLGADTTGLRKGESALTSLAAAGAKTEARVASSMNQVSGSISAAGKSSVMSGFQMRGFTQQLSQVGQMGAVTGDYLKAFAIQLPDIGLAFGVLGTVIGTLAAVALPTLMSAFSGAGGAIEASKKSLENLTDASGAYVAAAAAMGLSTDELRTKYGALAVEARAALTAIADVRLVESLNASKVAIDEIGSSLSKVSMFSGFRVLRDDFGATAEQASILANRILLLERADGLKAQAAAALSLQDAMRAAYGSVEAMDPAMQRAYGQLAEIVVAAGEVQGGIEASTTSIWDFVSGANAAAQGLAGAVGQAQSLASAAAAAAANIWSAMSAMAEQKSRADSYIGNSKLIGAYQEYGRGRSIGAEMQAATVYADKLADSLKGAGKAGGGGGKKITDAMKAAEKKLKDAEEASEQLREELEQPMVNAVESVSDAFGDFVANGFKDFKGFVSSILDSFKNMISEMIAYAVKNRIMMSLGLTSGVSPGYAAAASGLIPGAAPGGGIMGLLGAGNTVATAASGGGILSGILGTWGGGTGLLGGAGSVVTGLLEGGLAGAGSALSSALGGATAGISGLATAVGAIAVPLLAVGALVSFFSTKTKQLDAGLVSFIHNGGALVKTFETVEKSKFWGLSKSTGTTMTDAEKRVTNSIVNIVKKIQGSVKDAAKYLGIGGATFKKFAYSIWVTAKDRTGEETMAAFQKKLVGMGNSFARMIPGLAKLVRNGEGAADAIQRLARELAVVNETFRALGYTLYNTSLRGAAAASKFVKAFGGLEAYAKTISSYFDNFYTEEEKIAELRRKLRVGLKDANIDEKIPKSTEAFRALVDRLMDSGQTGKAAKLIKLHGLYVQLQDALGNTTDSVKDLVAALDPNNFATLWEFEKAQRLVAGGKPLPGDAGPQVYSGLTVATQTPAAQEQAQQTTAAMQTQVDALVQVTTFVKRTSDLLRQWEVTGMPPERAVL